MDVAPSLTDAPTLPDAAKIDLGFYDEFDVEGSLDEDTSDGADPTGVADSDAFGSFCQEIDASSLEEVLALRGASYAMDHGFSSVRWMVWMVHRVWVNDPSVTSLSFANMEFPECHGKSIELKLAEALKHNTYLEHLELPNANLQPETITMLAEALSTNAALKSLNLEGNAIDGAGLIHIADGLKLNRALEVLKLLHQKARNGALVEERFDEMLDGNRTLIKLSMEVQNPLHRSDINRKLMRNVERKRRERRVVSICSPRGRCKMKHFRFSVSEVAKDAKDFLLQDFCHIRRKSDTEDDAVETDICTSPRLNELKCRLLGEKKVADHSKYTDHYHLFQSVTEETTIHKPRPKAGKALHKRQRGHIVRNLCDIDVVDRNVASKMLKKETGEASVDSHGKHWRQDIMAKVRQEKPSTMWDVVIGDLCEKGTQDPVSRARQDSCSAVRLLVYGEVITDPKELHKVCNESVGSKDKVVQLWRRWRALDMDNSGRVDVPEFRAFLRKQLCGEQLEKVEASIKDIFGKKSSCSLDDLMRAIWPTADCSAVKLMKAWIDEHQAQIRNTKTPPLMSEEERLGFEELFYNVQRFGAVTIDQLVKLEYLDREHVSRYMEDFEKSSSDELSVSDFLHIVCPLGHRVSEEDSIVRDVDGGRLYFVPSQGKKGEWMTELSLC